MNDSATPRSARQLARNKGLAWVSAITLGAGAASTLGAVALATSPEQCPLAGCRRHECQRRDHLGQHRLPAAGSHGPDDHGQPTRRHLRSIVKGSTSTHTARPETGAEARESSGAGNPCQHKN